MSESIQVKIGATLTAPTKLIRLVKPNNIAELVKCECYINVGIFFDGTGNNYDEDLPKLKHSNIARLADTYRNEPTLGYFKTYIPGVGTPFSQIGEVDESRLGSSFGIGCEARVLYAMLALLNSIHRAAFGGQLLFTRPQVRALCSVGKRGKASHADLVILQNLGLNSGLLMPDFFGLGARDEFFVAQSQMLAAKLTTGGKPTIKECFIDVFGFSRGAAEARVFCSWLDQLLVNGKFAGITVRLRFVGLMDTVASGGFWSNLRASISNVPGGHSGWAAVEYLRLKNTLENCVHMVAMHELRKNFPLDEAGVSGALPPNTQEFAYPGTHSDVGGGYEPCELGVSVGKSLTESDALKLSQIPLNHMLECAKASGAPMEKNRATSPTGFDPFSTSPIVLKAYADFLATSTMTARPIKDWLQPYLNWRWQNRLVYADLSHVKKSSSKDREILLKFNKILIRDAELLERVSSSNQIKRLLSVASNSFAKADEIAKSLLDHEAKDVLFQAQKASKVDDVISNFFDSYVHDSLAGFNQPTLEATGYWRYRKGFVGGATGDIVSNKADHDDIQVA